MTLCLSFDEKREAKKANDINGMERQKIEETNMTDCLRSRRASIITYIYIENTLRSRNYSCNNGIPHGVVEYTHLDQTVSPNHGHDHHRLPARARELVNWPS